MNTERLQRSDVEAPPGAVRYRIWKVRSIIEEHWFSYLLFVPTLVFLVLLLWVPFLQGLWMSLHQWTFVTQEWIGLGNYEFLFTWKNFFISMKATVLFATTTFVQLAFALVAALLVHNLKRYKSLSSGLMLVPYTMAPVVTGLIWVFLLNPDFGPIFQYPLEWGLIDETFFFASNGETAMAAITLVTAWTFWPFMFIILLATLDGIPESHYETGQIYGANRIQRFLYITLPQLKSAILIVVSLRMIWNLSKVSQPLAMTGGGPGFETSILAILLYRYSWERGAYGLAFAVGAVLVVFTIAFIILFISEFERESVEAQQ